MGLCASRCVAYVAICETHWLISSQALLYAHEDTDGYGQVLQSTLGIVFLATPHRGSDTANLANIFVTIAKTCQTTTTVGLRPMAARTDILEYLSRDSTALQSLITSDRHRLKLLSIVTFYESVNTPPLSSIVRQIKYNHQIFIANCWGPRLSIGHLQSLAYIMRKCSGCGKTIILFVVLNPRRRAATSR